MSLKKILVHVDHLEASERRLRRTTVLAQVFDASVNALYVDSWALWASASAYGPEITPALIENQRTVSESQQQRAKGYVDRISANAQFPIMWIVNEGEVAGRICANARLSDLTVIGGRSREYLTAPGLVDQVVLGAGRPVLLLPDDLLSSDKFNFKRIVIGWNASREATRAIHDALPFLHKADAIIIVTAIPETEERKQPEGMSLLVEYLQAHGLAVEIEIINHTSSVGNGEALLAAAAAKDADMLVMGAYGHSRWREIILGGSTRHVLKHAQLPVLMSH